MFEFDDLPDPTILNLTKFRARATFEMFARLAALRYQP